MMLHIHRRKSDGVWTCGRCGWVIDDQARPQRATCPVCPTLARDRWEPIAIGDLVERWLTRIGVTQERVERWTRTEGKPGGCGCAGRKRWLNRAGNNAQRWVRGRLLKVRRFYVGS